MNLLVLGPQGSGKGTQASRISSEFGVPHISTGEMFRAAVANGSELGRRVAPILAAGGLVPNDVTVALIRERLYEDDARAGFVLDGFPRNLVQADALDAMLDEVDRRLDAVLFFNLPDRIAIDRLLGRAAAERRGDDTPEVIERRLATYHEHTAPVVEQYRATGKVVPIHANQPVDAVFAEIQDALIQIEARAAQ